MGKQSDYSQGMTEGMNRMNEVFDEILPVRVFRDFQMEKFGLFHRSTLVCRFATKQLAKDFIDYQKTIHPEDKYILEEVARKPEKQLTEDEAAFIDRTELALDMSESVSKEDLKTYEQLIEKRAALEKTEEKKQDIPMRETERKPRMMGKAR